MVLPTEGEEDTNDTKDTGTVQKKCTKCGEPVKNHPGPTGVKCNNPILEKNKGAEVDRLDGELEPKGAVGGLGVPSDLLLRQLVAQMSEMNTNLVRMSEMNTNLVTMIEKQSTELNSRRERSPIRDLHRHVSSDHQDITLATPAHVSAKLVTACQQDCDGHCITESILVSEAILPLNILDKIILKLLL